MGFDKSKKAAKKDIHTEKRLGEWLYFSTEDLTVQSLLPVLSDAYQVEIWQEAGVLEVTIGEGTSMDFESARVHPKDEATQAFVQEHQCRTLFLVTFTPEEYDAAEGVMKRIIEKIGGFFCGDTEDFTPIIK